MEGGTHATCSSSFLPGYVCHITHRCHKQEFLLKFSRNRNNWLKWLFEAKKRYGLCILNYIVTSNHIHLLLMDNGKNETPQSLQLIAGRVAQDNNKRKGRKGAFWEDHYHATAIATDDHLAQCMTYIDLNMIRAGVVTNPKDWAESGFAELYNQKQRYQLTDTPPLLGFLGIKNIHELREQTSWVEEQLKADQMQREPLWSEAVAVGSEDYITVLKDKLGYAVSKRKIEKFSLGFVLKEDEAIYTLK